jgi:uncharacterized protein YraI
MPLRRWAVVLCALLTWATVCGCGPESDAPDDTQASTFEIARGFASSGDAAAARVALEGLDVPNPSQWLLLTTENAIADPAADLELKKALVSLSLELGLREATIRNWGEANGIVEPLVPEAALSQGGPSVAPAAAAPVASAVGATAAIPPAAPLAALPTATASASLTNSAPATASAPAAAAVPVTVTASVTEPVNLRQGPGTEYALAGAFNPGDSAEIGGRNESGDWFQVRLATGAAGWVFAPLIAIKGSTEGVQVAADIPTPPPAPTAEPVAIATAAAPAPAAPASAAPVETATAEPAPAPNPSDTPVFSLAAHRLWSKDENGGCAGQHLLRITVLDANGAPLNGIVLQGIYTGATLVTGDQGKGDGRVEYDLYGTGEGFQVVRNNDGREVVSDKAEGFTTKSLDIPVPQLIEAGYCDDDTTCQVFYNSYGCTGHHSWEATFKRNF